MPDVNIAQAQMGDHKVTVSAWTERGMVDVTMNGTTYELDSTDAHYLATLLRTAVDMIDFRAQLDARR